MAEMAEIVVLFTPGMTLVKVMERPRRMYYSIEMSKQLILSGYKHGPYGNYECMAE
jgi:hypothetical protein